MIAAQLKTLKATCGVVILELLEVCAQHPVASLRFHAKEIVLVKITHTEVGLPLRA